MRRDEYMKESTRLGHAIQTGVMYDHQDLGFELETAGQLATNVYSEHPKHLRTGINMLMCDLGALVGLLVEKGVITESDYYIKSVEMLELEVAKYEADLSRRRGGTKITLV